MWFFTRSRGSRIAGARVCGVFARVSSRLVAFAVLACCYNNKNERNSPYLSMSSTTFWSLHTCHRTTYVERTASFERRTDVASTVVLWASPRTRLRV